MILFKQNTNIGMAYFGLADCISRNENNTNMFLKNVVSKTVPAIDSLYKFVRKLLQPA